MPKHVCRGAAWPLYYTRVVPGRAHEVVPAAASDSAPGTASHCFGRGPRRQLRLHRLHLPLSPYEIANRIGSLSRASAASSSSSPAPAVSSLESRALATPPPSCGSTTRQSPAAAEMSLVYPEERHKKMKNSTLHSFDPRVRSFRRVLYEGSTDRRKDPPPEPGVRAVPLEASGYIRTGRDRFQLNDASPLADCVVRPAISCKGPNCIVLHH